MSAPPKALQRILGPTTVTVAVVVMNVATYALTVAAAHLLGPVPFGLFSALMGLLVVLNVVALGLQATGARHVAIHGTNRDGLLTLTDVSRRAALGMFVFGLLMAPVIGRVIHVDSWWAAVALSVTAASLTLVGGYAGILQGARRWVPLSVIFIVLGMTRFGFGLAGLSLSRTASAVLGGVAVGAVVTMLTALAMVRRPSHLKTGAGERDSRRAVIREVGHSTHALLAFFALSNADVLIARAHLDPHTTGLFAAGLVLTKAVLFLPQFVIVVAFPSMSEAGSRQRHLQGLGVVLAFGGLACLGVRLLPGLALKFVGGTAYSAVGSRLWIFGVVGTLLAAAQFLVYSALSQTQTRSVYVVWAGLVALLVAGWLAQTLDQLLLVRLVTALLTLIGLVVLMLRHDPGKGAT